ncbi:MAG: asparagine synthase (glutamine-hydrolyzing) [Candidatus Magnetomorum sp.]|nr:asparagine synthase (glutamine-hydrolyzing) [Candidatus Magnetomorum sp.]
MCGFLFQYKINTARHVLIDSAKHAMHHLKHRGPDDQGIWCEPPCVIGHHRLSIIDIEKSKQPFCDPSGRYVLAYNGEVYNYKELRQSLEPRWQFKTLGDTEVILAGLIIHGDAFISLMEGMWAFILWDKHDETAILSRDRMGKKPLFYQCHPHSFACASSLNALSTLFLSPMSEDINSTADYLRYGYYLPGTTAYQNVFEVLPGNMLIWHPQTDCQQKPYWSLPIGGFTGSKKEACQLLRETLVQSIKRRLIADVEVGAFLSGGIDSSLIVALLSKKFGINLKTFTLGFDEASFDETPYAQIIADMYTSDHFTERCHHVRMEPLIALILQHAGQPFSDSSLLPTALLSELASRTVKVVLSGDGGDELFSGYQRYQARVLLQWYTRLPKLLRKNINHLVRSIPEPVAHHSHSLLKKANLFLDIADHHQKKSPYIAPLLYSSDDFYRLAPELSDKGHPAPVLPIETEGTSFLEMMAMDALVYLPQDILAKVDRASMAYSLETRIPFLDSKVVELAFSLPSSWHRQGFKGKRMLWKTFSDLLPKQIWNRRKQGFSVPLHQWFKNNAGDDIIHLLDHIKTPLNPLYVKHLLQEHRMGQRDHGHRLWNIYVYLQWVRHDHI